MATVRLRAPLKRLAGDRAELSLEGATVGELMVGLERENPAMAGWILDERGLVRRHINVFVNGELVDAKTQVGKADVVDVLPAISGG
ncbi:MAG TPA: MoaD/ThiS family protein [Thermoleophilaceae bacterium]|jgi:molybdopterin converting factor small subunit